MKRISVVAVILVVVTAVPAIAATSACPTTVPSAGFTDLGSTPAAAVDAIDCLAFYGIATGTTSTTFSPSDTVARWQMALFLTRQLEVHGVTLPSGASQGFTDLAGLSSDAVKAINQLKQLGVATGTTATTFAPSDPVARWQMALFLKRFLLQVGVALSVSPSGPFTDLGGVSTEATTAINQLNEVGVATGTTATTFSPYQSVARWQMALFLTRSLDADGITPGNIGVVTNLNKTTDKLSFSSLDGSFSTTDLGFADKTKWRVNGVYTTAAAFETALTLGDDISWRQLQDELWLNDAIFRGTPTVRTSGGMITVEFASGIAAPAINYQAKDLTAQLGIATSTGGVVKYRIGKGGASTLNLTVWESWVDDIIAGDTSGTVSVQKEGADLIWTVSG